MAETHSAGYNVKYYAWPQTALSKLNEEDSAAFQARDDELDVLANQEDFGRWSWADYTTLSYIWGDISDMRKIAIIGCMVEVAANLYKFLRHYTTSEQRPSPRMGLWVDAIAINQIDINERNVQSQRMRTIYSCSFGTTIRLGYARATPHAYRSGYDCTDKGDGSHRSLRAILIHYTD